MIETQTSALAKWVQSPSWFFVFAVSLGLCLLVFLAQALFFDIRPGNVFGLTYGILAAAFMLAAATFGLRRRLTRFTKKLGAGRAQTWVQLHVYGGALFMILVLMHTGFSLPTGLLTWWLFIASLWVTASGLLGVLLQKWIPKILTSGLTIEAIYERIPELIAEIREKSEKLVAISTEPVREFYRKNIAPALLGPQVKLIYYIDITGGIQSPVKQFNHLSKMLAEEDKKKLEQLRAYYKTKLELDAHYTLQKALRWWLYLHVPASLLLLLLLALHVYAILYY